jgi:hypothetical protein
MLTTEKSEQKAKPQSTSQPLRKVGFASFAGAMVVLSVGILNDHVSYFEKKPVSADIAAAATAVVEFLVAYFVPHGKDETIVEEDGQLKTAKK